MQRFRADDQAGGANEQPTDRWPAETVEPSYTRDIPPPYSYASPGSGLVVEKLSQIAYYLLGLLEGLLTLRLVFRLLGANPLSPIAQLLYDLSQPFLAPFRDLLPNPTANGQVLELTTVMAMAIYVLCYCAVAQLLRLFAPPSA